MGRKKGWVRTFLMGLAGLAALLALAMILSQTNLVPHVLRTPHFAVGFRGEGREAQWSEDIDYLTVQLARLHPEPFARVSEDTFRERATELTASAGHFSDRELYAEIISLVALLGDAHTSAEVAPHLTNMFDVRYSLFPDGLVVVKAPEEHAALVGSRVTAFNGIAVEEAVRRVARFIPHENDAWRVRQSGTYLLLESVLSRAGITNEGEPLTVSAVTNQGQAIRTVLSPKPAHQVLNSQNVYIDAFDDAPPMAERHPDAIYWHATLPDHDTLYIQYDACANDPAYAFRDFTRNVEEEMDRAGTRHVIVDVRENGGGSSRVFRPMLKLFRDRKQADLLDTVVVLIGHGTFSSALINTNQMIVEVDAVTIGAPTGGAPRSGGQVLPPYVTLPHSGIVVQVSRQIMDRVPSHAQENSLLPDILAPRVFADYVQGRDAGLEAALFFIKMPVTAVIQDPAEVRDMLQMHGPQCLFSYCR